MKYLITFLLALSMIFMLGSNLFAQGKKIVPGVVITRENLDDYLDELKELIPFPCRYYIYGLERGWITMPIVEFKGHRPTVYDGVCIENEGKFKVADDNTLIGDWMLGCAFPYPKTGQELAWSVFRRREFPDQQTWPCVFRMFFKDGSPDRSFVWRIWKRFLSGRYSIPPIPLDTGNAMGNLESKESILISKPFDVKGFITLRIRHESLDKLDDNFAYIPALRRIRRLTGADVTDPLLGSDVIPDHFEVWRQKINHKMTFKMREGKFLQPRYYSDAKKPDYDPKEMKYCRQLDWEIRPMWILEVHMNDPTYAYTRGILWVEKAPNALLWVSMYYDQRGRLTRGAFMYPHAREPGTGHMRGIWGNNYFNFLTGHQTFMDIGPQTQKVPLESFRIKDLLKKSR